MLPRKKHPCRPFLISFSALPLLLAKPFRNNFFIGSLRGESPPINKLKDNKFVVIGDSHAQDIWKLLRKTYQMENF